MAITNWYDAILKSFFTKQFLKNYALIINGAVKIQPQDFRINKIIIINNSSGTIYLGADSNVNTSNGFPILPNNIIILNCSSDFSFYLYGNNQEIRVLEIE